MTTTFTLEIDWDGVWSDETAYVRRIQTWQGFAQPSDAMAQPGRCTILLDNTDRRFSPGYTSGPLAGKLRPRRPLRISASAGGQTWVLFRGTIESIAPDAGLYGPRTCRIEGVDGIALLARQRVGLPPAASKAVDEAVAEIVAAAYTPPAASYDDNGDTLTHYGQHWKPERTTCLDALREVAEAVWGRFYIQRDGTATFWSRRRRQDPSRAAALVLDDAAVEGLHLVLDVANVINLVQVKVYPVETVGAEQELWRARTTLHLAPGQQRVIYAPFHDDNGQRCGAVDVIAPVPTTDYLVNDRSDGSGFNYTTDPAFSISSEIEATRLKLTLGNSATGTLYVTLLRVRGKPIRTYDPITLERGDSTSQSLYQTQARVVDLPMQADPSFGEQLAAFLVGRGKDPVLAAESVRIAGRDEIAGVNVFSLNLLDKILIGDSQSGADRLSHWVRAIAYDLTPRGAAVTLHLERNDEITYWLLGKAGYGELGAQTRLGL